MTFLELLLQPATIALVLSTVAAILVSLKVLDEKRKNYVATATSIAFNVVNDIVAMRKKQGAEGAFEKVAAGLKVANDWMQSNGWKPLSESEQKVVEIGFQALNGQEKK